MTVTESGATYNRLARALHWTMAGLVLLQISFGVIMTYQGPEPNLWASLANALGIYDLHKLLGLVLLTLVVVRLANRLLRGAPPSEPTLAPWQRESATLVHSWIYLLLVLVPMLGWIGVSLYPALTVFGVINLPALTAPDRPLSETVLAVHALAAFALLALIATHVGAALYHHFVRRDGVLRRMWPGLKAPGG